MPTISKERQALRKAYKSNAWAKKVDMMSEDKVIAIYLRLKQQNKL